MAGMACGLIAMACIPLAVTGAMPWWLAVALGAFLLFTGAQLRSAAYDIRGLNERHNQAMELVQRELTENRHAVDTLADGLDVAIFICDPKATVLYANRRAMEMFRFEDLQGRSLLAISLSYDLEALVFEVFRTGERMQAEMNFSYPENRVNVASAWLETSGQRLFLAIYEITDLRRLERVRRDFVANVSHELRTPLATIRAMAETLVDDQGQDKDLSERYLSKIVSEVDRLSLIANDLLILSAAESNPVRKQECDIADLTRGIAAQLQSKAKEKSLTLTYSGPEHLRIDANSSQMSQVIINLVDNALNYSSEGSVTVTLSANDHEAVLKVADTGIGIASTDLPRVFERFYRVDKGRSRATGGTGLGLSIVKHIVEAHGGEVSVESALNEGSTFTVRLPLISSEPIPISEA